MSRIRNLIKERKKYKNKKTEKQKEEKIIIS